MGPAITFLVAYRCPQCRAELEARSGLAQGWVRCPKCGRASLPPEHMRAAPAARPTAGGDDILVIGPEPELRPLRRPGSVSPEPTSDFARSILFRLGLILAVILALVSLLDRNQANAAFFGFLALLILVFWAIPPRRR